MEVDQSKPVHIEGILENIIYTSEETHYTVARLRLDDDVFVTIVGTIMAANQGERIKVKGTWSKHPKYGNQIQVQSFEVILPDSRQAIENYFSARSIPGIGPSLGKRLLEKFGEEIWHVMDHEPHRLLSVSGIGKKKLAQILKVWRQRRSTSRAFLFMAKYGIHGRRAAKICDYYGGNVMAILKHHPYQLAIDIDGIGFTTADMIAQKIGIQLDDPERIQAALIHVLQEAQSQGNCYLPQEELLRVTQSLLNLDDTKIQEGLEELLQKNSSVYRVAEADQPIYLRYLYYCETKIAESLQNNLNFQIKRQFPKLEHLLAEMQKKMGIQFVEEQLDAIQQALTSKVAIITGGPGVGKTTIIRALVYILEKSGCTVALAAPTGRAAKRLAEASGGNASTIHRLLAFNARTNEFTKNAKSPLELDHIIIDETSMVDIPLAYHLLQAIPCTACITFVGDADQLPSVGPGNFLADLIAAEQIPTTKLRQIFRQAEGSSIVQVAHTINQGRIPKIVNHTSSDIFFLPVASVQEGADLVVDLITKRLPSRYGFNAKTEIQVITPMYRGDVGADNLNQRLANALNPQGEEVAKHDFRVGDKVMQLVNDYEKDVYNGDIGIISSYYAKDGYGYALVDFGDNRILEYKSSDMENLTRSYAITIHKSQGSEYPAVVIPLFTAHFIMLERNLIYTAITRGKKIVVLVGDWRALQLAVHNVRAANRYTRLIKYLTEGTPPLPENWFEKSNTTTMSSSWIGKK